MINFILWVAICFVFYALGHRSATQRALKIIEEMKKQYEDSQK